MNLNNTHPIMDVAALKLVGVVIKMGVGVKNFHAFSTWTVKHPPSENPGHATGVLYKEPCLPPHQIKVSG